MSLKPEVRARIIAAIARTEAQTSAEIYCVHARRVSGHFDVILGWAASAALLVPLLLVPLGFSTAWAPGLAGGWTAAHLAAVDQTVAATLAAYAATQAMIFALVCGLGIIPWVRRLMVPPMVRQVRCRRMAQAQFLAHSSHDHQGGPVILVFACEADHQVEIVTNAEMDDDMWTTGAALLAAGFRSGDAVGGYERTVEHCGAALARRFPPGARHNDVANRLVEL